MRSNGFLKIFKDFKTFSLVLLKDFVKTEKVHVSAALV